MLQIHTIVGNIHEDTALATDRDDHAAAGTLEQVAIDAADRVKSRLRTTTDAGTDLGIVVDRPELRDGDVLVADDDRMIVVTFADRESLAIDLPSTMDTETAIELGHRIGNQHWDLAVDGDVAFVPLAADVRIIEDVLEEVLPAVSTRVETVDASLFIDEASPDHDHDHDHADGDAAHARAQASTHIDGTDHSHGPHDGGEDHGEHAHEHHSHGEHEHHHDDHGDHNA